MARAIYPHELSDPDFQWLITTYKENAKVSFTIESSCLPVTLVLGGAPDVFVEDVTPKAESKTPPPKKERGEMKDESDYS